jgi:PAS domain S-box-containing protein
MSRANHFPWCDRTNLQIREAVMTVQATEEELLKVLDVLALSTDAMFAINQRHRIVFWNRALTRLLGWGYDDVVGKTCGGVLAGVDDYGNRYCSDDCPIVSIATRGDAVRQFRLRAKAKSGEKTPVEITVLKFMLPQGNGMLLVHVVRPAAAEALAALAEQHPQESVPFDPRLQELTARELEVLSLLAAGEKTRVIADRLGIAPLTARNHINNMFEKLDVHSKAEAIALAYRMHVV